MITGANSEIGFETTRELARKGTEIILPARPMTKAKEAVERIKREIPSASLIPAVLDLASLAMSASSQLGFPNTIPNRRSIS